MIGIDISMDLQDIQDLTNIEQDIAEQVLDVGVDIFKEECPVDTGRMKKSIHHDTDSIIVDTPYALYTEYSQGWASRAYLKLSKEVTKLCRELSGN